MNNREIKFRVWHKEDKCFIYVEPFDPHTITSGGYNKDKNCYYHFWPDANISGELCKIKNCSLQNRPVQQFTGLKDSNRKDIYEGDIIKYQYDSAYPDKFDKSIVEYEEFEPDKWGYQVGQGYGNVEVIGNIFENPELIK